MKIITLDKLVIDPKRPLDSQLRNTPYTVSFLWEENSIKSRIFQLINVDMMLNIDRLRGPIL